MPDNTNRTDIALMLQIYNEWIARSNPAPDLTEADRRARLEAIRAAALAATARHWVPQGSYAGRVSRVAGDWVELEVTHRNDQQPPLSEGSLTQAIDAMAIASTEADMVIPVYPAPRPSIARNGQTVAPSRRANRGPRQYRRAPGCKAFPS